jgi:cyclopropane fatty-acyl-phospholipid synthase-like methyltransferase
MEIPTAAGYEWKGAEKVAVYLAAQEGDELKAEIVGAHGRLVELIGRPAEAPIRFLDLGAGAGAVSGSVMAYYDNASGVLAEMSAPMMDNGGDKLAQFKGRYRYVEYDMNSDDWPAEMAGPFDAVVSARAIHHLTDERKGWVFRKAFEVLAPGGVFVNWDLWRPEDQPQKPSHPTATAAVQLELLRAAGFEDVTQSHETARRALFSGRKPAR